jgi:predicted HicB family RNase H-like nuclease
LDKNTQKNTNKNTIIPPKVHAAVAQAAEVSGKSINQWAADMLDQAAHSHGFPY